MLITPRRTVFWLYKNCTIFYILNYARDGIFPGCSQHTQFRWTRTVCTPRCTQLKASTQLTFEGIMKLVESPPVSLKWTLYLYVYWFCIVLDCVQLRIIVCVFVCFRVIVCTCLLHRSMWPAPHWFIVLWLLKSLLTFHLFNFNITISLYYLNVLWWCVWILIIMNNISM